jgi:hypothetical protein
MPDRRTGELTSISHVNAAGVATDFDVHVGFDEAWNPKEVFLYGAKEGSDQAAIFSDVSVAISVALQHGVTAEEMLRSVTMYPLNVEGTEHRPASVIGAALSLIAEYERVNYTKD